MQLSNGDFRSDFARNCNFYTGNAAQFGNRSDPFFEISFRVLLSKVDMRAY
jgi:hypothetical protein